MLFHGKILGVLGKSHVYGKTVTSKMLRVYFPFSSWRIIDYVSFGWITIVYVLCYCFCYELCCPIGFLWCDFGLSLDPFGGPWAPLAVLWVPFAVLALGHMHNSWKISMIIGERGCNSVTQPMIIDGKGLKFREIAHVFWKGFSLQDWLMLSKTSYI